MIRFIDLTGQISCEEDRYFAWFDTITDTFLEFGGTQIFVDWEEFEGCFNQFVKEDIKVRKHDYVYLERFKGLFLWNKEIKKFEDVKVGLIICRAKYPYKPLKISQIFTETQEIRLTPVGHLEDDCFYTVKFKEIESYIVCKND